MASRSLLASVIIDRVLSYHRRHSNGHGDVELISRMDEHCRANVQPLTSLDPFRVCGGGSGYYHRWPSATYRIFMHQVVECMTWTKVRAFLEDFHIGLLVPGKVLRCGGVALA